MTPFHDIPAARRPARPPALAEQRRRKRMDAEERAALQKRLTSEYGTGLSMRQLADRHGWSYGTVNRLLHDAKAPVRTRGGANRTSTRGTR